MNEALLIAQILEKNGKSFALLIPYGAQFDDVFAVLKDFEAENQKKFDEQKKADEARKAEEAAKASSETAQ